MTYGFLGVQLDFINGRTNQTGVLNTGYAWTYGPEMTYEEYVHAWLDICQSVGITRAWHYSGARPPYLDGDITAAIAQLYIDHGYEPWFEGVDEITVQGESPAFSQAYQAVKSRRIHAVGGKVTTNGTYLSLGPPYYNGYVVGSPLTAAQWPSYVIPAQTFSAAETRADGLIYMGDSCKRIWELQSGRAVSDTEWEGHYFQTRSLDPRIERFECGYRPYWSNTFSQPTWYTAHAWADIHTGAPAYGIAYLSKDQNGVFRTIPTLHGCGIREGWKDHKYVLTWKYYRDQMALSYPDDVAASDLAVGGKDVAGGKTNGILAKYYEAYAHTKSAGHKVTFAQWDADRVAMIAEIETLRSLAPQSRGGVFGRKVAKVCGVPYPKKVSGAYI
jgi:hypothetical protein